MLRALTAGDDAIVTTETGPYHGTVIDPHHGCPVASIMTILAASR
jgi:hypothetical protein